MPSAIYFANGKDVEVTEDPDALSSRLHEHGRLPVRFEVRGGGETKVVYVNPQHILYFEETPPFDERLP
jgi:hypothetical protein